MASSKGLAQAFLAEYSVFNAVWSTSFWECHGKVEFHVVELSSTLAVATYGSLTELNCGHSERGNQPERFSLTSKARGDRVEHPTF